MKATARKLNAMIRSMGPLSSWQVASSSGGSWGGTIAMAESAMKERLGCALLPGH